VASLPRCGLGVAGQVADSFLYDRHADAARPQRPGRVPGARDRRLSAALTMMGEALDAPRPIPEIVNRYASRGEWIFHDCCTRRNPSHTCVADIRQEYKPEQWRRMVLYHYESERAGEAIEQGGFCIAHRGERFALDRHPALPSAAMEDGSVDDAALRSLPGAVGW